jgi:hypothetical protein
LAAGLNKPNKNPNHSLSSIMSSNKHPNKNPNSIELKEITKIQKESKFH